MTRSMLVPLDGSGFGEKALPLALDLARRTGAALELALVHETVFLAEPASGGVLLSDQMEILCRQQEEQYLKDVAGRVRAALAQPVEAELLGGPIVDALVDRIHEKGTDWVVLSTHGRGPMSRFWLGSVADGLVRHAEVPLLVVRPSDEGPADLACPPTIRNVLICLDGSPMSESVLEPAIALGTIVGASFILLRVVKPVPFAGHDPLQPSTETFSQPIAGQLQQLARNYIDQVVARMQARSHQVEARVLVDAQPAVAIVEESQKQPDTLIAMSTHGRGGLVRAILGSVTDKVLRSATCPMLVYRPGKEPRTK